MQYRIVRTFSTLTQSHNSNLHDTKRHNRLVLCNPLAQHSSQTTPATMATFTWEEVKAHSTDADCWIAVHGNGGMYGFGMLIDR